LFSFAIFALGGCAADSGARDGAPGATAAPAPVRLFTVPEFCEGVVFDRDGVGYISSGKFVYCFTPGGKPEVWAETGGANGHKILADGTHLVCDRSQKAVLHLSADGKILGQAAGACDGKPLRAPNDLTLDTKSGGFYFTDPEESDLDRRIGTVHYVDSSGKVTEVDSGLAYGNGIALSADGKQLFVDETFTNRVYVYDVLAPGKLSPRRVFAELPKPPQHGKEHIANLCDGMCLDAGGNLYVAHFGTGVVDVIDPAGKHLRTLDAGNIACSNVAFGGPKRDQLFVTGGLGPIGKAEGAVFRIDLGVKGLGILPDGVKR
jgi:gluconolactonase